MDSTRGSWGGGVGEAVRGGLWVGGNARDEDTETSDELISRTRRACTVAEHDGVRVEESTGLVWVRYGRRYQAVLCTQAPSHEQSAFALGTEAERKAEKEKTEAREERRKESALLSIVSRLSRARRCRRRRLRRSPDSKWGLLVGVVETGRSTLRAPPCRLQFLTRRTTRIPAQLTRFILTVGTRRPSRRAESGYGG